MSIIKANHKIFFVKFFNWYISHIIKKDFKNIEFDKNFEFDENKSILFISNHFSWWDGFFAYFLNLILFKKKFHVMMLKEELKKRIIFSYIGAFSIERKSEEVEESLKYTCQLLKDPKNFVLIFPQGRLESNHKINISFRKGLEYIVKESKNNQTFQIIYSTILIDYFENRKPTAYISMTKKNTTTKSDIYELEKSYNEHYLESKKKQSQKYK